MPPVPATQSRCQVGSECSASSRRGWGWCATPEAPLPLAFAEDSQEPRSESSRLVSEGTSCHACQVTDLGEPRCPACHAGNISTVCERLAHRGTGCTPRGVSQTGPPPAAPPPHCHSRSGCLVLCPGPLPGLLSSGPGERNPNGCLLVRTIFHLPFLPVSSPIPAAEPAWTREGPRGVSLCL